MGRLLERGRHGDEGYAPASTPWGIVQLSEVPFYPRFEPILPLCINTFTVFASNNLYILLPLRGPDVAEQSSRAGSCPNTSWGWVPTTGRDGSGGPVVRFTRGHRVRGLFESAGECWSGVNVLKLLTRLGVVIAFGMSAAG